MSGATGPGGLLEGEGPGWQWWQGLEGSAQTGGKAG